MIQPNAEEAFAARIAAVSGKAAGPLDPTERIIHYQAARHFFHIQLPALWAVNVPSHLNRHTPGIEARAAGAAAPWPRAKSGGQIISETAPVGPLTNGAMTFGTEHWFPN
jgi:hypothetical protein